MSERSAAFVRRALRSCLVAAMLVACATPTEEELAKLEVDVVRAPEAAVRVAIIAGGFTRSVPVASGKAVALFGAPAAGQVEISVRALDASGTELEKLAVSEVYAGTKLVVTADFRPCEGDPRFGTPCTAGKGACARSGEWQCSDDHQHVACSVPAGEPGRELCNGIDDDCDGETDEAAELPDAPRCALNQGVCAGASATCAGAAGWGACDYGPHYEAVEKTCDGLDNDCDGVVDPMLADDADNCGSCGHRCSGETPACVGATCVASCGTGRHRCGTECASNLSAAACGTRCDPCPAPAHGIATCDGTSCGVSCDAGYTFLGGACQPKAAVLSITPANGAWGVDPHANVVVTFSVPMDGASVASALRETPSLGGALGWDASGTKLTITQPTLGAGGTYAVTVGGTAKDAWGRSLGADVTSRFSVAPTTAVFVFGGRGPDAPYFFNDAWLLVTSPSPTWVPIEASGGPASLTDAMVAYDSKRHRLLVYGGNDQYDATHGELWSLAFDRTANAWSWSQVATTGTAPVRYRAAMAYDAASDRLWVVAGNTARTSGGPACHTDVNALSLSTTPPAWSRPSASGGPPRGLVEAASAWDPAGRRFYLTQGTGSSAPNCWVPPAGDSTNHETFTLDVGGASPGWSSLVAIDQDARALAAATWTGTQLVTYGGDGPNGDRLFALDANGTSWQELTPASATNAPGSRADAGLVWLPTLQHALLFGGLDTPSGAYGTGLWLTPIGPSPAWAHWAVTGGPSDRRGPAMVVLDDVGDLVPPP